MSTRYYMTVSFRIKGDIDEDIGTHNAENFEAELKLLALKYGLKLEGTVYGE